MAFSSEDIVYHTPAGIALTATLYRPAGEGPFAAVIDAHGGRWCSETRMTNVRIDEALAAAGIVVMALDFRMPPDAQYPLPVADINFAIRWLHAHAADYGINPDWIGGVGTSSGGHQLALTALAPDDPKYRQGHTAEMDGVSAKVNYMILCWPVSDPPARYRYAIANKMDIHIQSHERYWPSEAMMAEGSPQRIVADGEAATLPPTAADPGHQRHDPVARHVGTLRRNLCGGRRRHDACPLSWRKTHLHHQYAGQPGVAGGIGRYDRLYPPPDHGSDGRLRRCPNCEQDSAVRPVLQACKRGPLWACSGRLKGSQIKTIAQLWVR